MIALSVHSLFEGIALGIMGNLNSAVNLMISILIHKWAESMSISIALNKTFPDIKTIFYLIFMYSFVTPIGTIIGIILADSTSEIV